MCNSCRASLITGAASYTFVMCLAVDRHRGAHTFTAVLSARGKIQRQCITEAELFCVHVPSAPGIVAELTLNQRNLAKQAGGTVQPMD